MSSYVYFIRVMRADGPVKIGVSRRPQNRLLTMRACCPDRLDLAAILEGGETLERRFHAAFHADHLHHEWFSGSAKMDDTIAAIVAGDFDTSALPDPLLIRPKKVMPREAVEAGRMARRITYLVRAGVVVPEEVQQATSTYGFHADELERRRRIVSEWVNAYDASLREAA